MTDKQNKSLAMITGCLGLAIAFLLFSAPVKAELAPGSIKLDKSPQAVLDKLVSSSAPPNPFNSPGEQDKEIRIVPAFQGKPLARYTLDFDKGGKTSFQKGELASLAGDLNYSGDDAKNQLDKALTNCQSQLEGKAKCVAPEFYQIPVISNVGIFVQVWRKDETASRVKTGDYLIDEFYASQGITLKEGEGQKIAVNWKIPAEIKEGRYYFSFFVTANQRFPLSGFPLNVFSPGIVYPFDISGEGGNGVEIDKSEIKLNGNAYSQVLPAPTVEPDDDGITVEVPVTNLDSAEQKVTVRYELYRWTQENSENLLKKENTVETVAPGEIKAAAFSFVPNDSDGVYDIKVTASTPQSQSVADIHFSLKDRNEGIFLFLGVAKGQDNKDYPIFCPRNARGTGMFPATVKLSLNENGKDVASWDKKGVIEAVDGRCLVIKEDRFSQALGSGSCVKLTGNIFGSGNQSTDAETVDYNCEPKNPAETGASQTQKEPAFTGKNMVIILAILLILAVAGGAAILINKNKQKIDG